MICFPNAKINIGLYVTERRSDGFHNIETLFYPLPLTDILEIIVNEDAGAKDVALKITGNPVEGKWEENLCTRAYRLLQKDYSLPPVRMYLHKIIPSGAGLGGGSSDGAYTLVLLNQMFELGLEPEELKGYASRLGSDCVFFIENLPALGTGKGQELASVPLNLSGCFMIVVKPPVFVSTSEAYAGIQPEIPEISLRELIKLPINTWKESIKNDFEDRIFAAHPEIMALKDSFYDRGALYASMTGSGSAVFGIFEKELLLKDAFPGMFYWGHWI